MDYEDLHVGDFAEFSKTITETDIVLFAGVTGDFNPAHVDHHAAARGRFGGPIAHGMLSASLICTVLGMRLPGPGTIHIEQSLRFLAPVRPGDTVTVRAEVRELLPHCRVRLLTLCFNQKGLKVIEGESLVLAPSRQISGPLSEQSPR